MSDIPQIDVAELSRRCAQGAPLVDVREQHEFSKARVPGATLIPLGEIVERVDEVPRDATVYVICASGSRSARAVQHLRSVGVDAVNVAGGTIGWINAGLPVDADAGSEAGAQ
ncbi:MAG: rhodanese-like domain-containing protein [Microthrixaceae bacterium]